jgi:hypothetical protein
MREGADISHVYATSATTHPTRRCTVRPGAPLPADGERQCYKAENRGRRLMGWRRPDIPRPAGLPRSPARPLPPAKSIADRSAPAGLAAPTGQRSLTVRTVPGASLSHNSPGVSVMAVSGLLPRSRSIPPGHSSSSMSIRPVGTAWASVLTGAGESPQGAERASYRSPVGLSDVPDCRIPQSRRRLPADSAHRRAPSGGHPDAPHNIVLQVPAGAAGLKAIRSARRAPAAPEHCVRLG